MTHALSLVRESPDHRPVSGLDLAQDDLATEYDTPSWSDPV
jgi:hypothetical protein